MPRLQIQCQKQNNEFHRCTNKAEHFFIYQMNTIFYHFSINKALCKSCYDKETLLPGNIKVSRKEYLKDIYTMFYKNKMYQAFWILE